MKMVAAALLALALSGWGAAQGTLVDNCAYPKPQATAVTFGSLQGALLGHGPRGVLLSNDSGNGVCEWITLAQHLVKRGFAVLTYTYASPYPTDNRAADLHAALSALRRQGVRDVTLVGASQGANLSLQAASERLLGVTGVVALSPEAHVLATAGDPTRPFAQNLRVRALFVTASDDPYDANTAAPALYGAAPVRDKRLITVQGMAHGTELLRDPKVLQRVVDFITK